MFSILLFHSYVFHAVARLFVASELSMKNSLSLLLCVITLNGLSCSRENELDKAIDEAQREVDSYLDADIEDKVSIRYFEEDKAR